MCSIILIHITYTSQYAYIRILIDYCGHWIKVQVLKYKYRIKFILSRWCK